MKRKNKISKIFILILLSLSFILLLHTKNSYASCLNIDYSFEKTPITCDGHPFNIRIEYTTKDPWGDYLFFKAYGSPGIDFIDFPDKDLRTVKDNYFNLKISCMNINEGEIYLRFLNYEGDSCSEKINLYLNKPEIKNNIIISNPPENTNPTKNESQNDDSNITDLLIILGLIIITFILITFFILNNKSTKKTKISQNKK